MSIRQITGDDLWSAIRGLGMFKMTDAELEQLRDEHTPKALFASQVIAKAATQVRAIRSGFERRSQLIAESMDITERRYGRV